MAQSRPQGRKTTIKVLLADDSDVMRTAIRTVLNEDTRIRIVGEAATFAETVQKIADRQPDVLVLDLHMPEKRDFTPASVKTQLGSVERIVAVSFANGDDSKALAEGYGAAALLDKMNLYETIVPAILQCVLPEVAKHHTASA
jgi:two-component system response regulator NreC